MTIACTDCGTLQDIPPLPWGAIAVCPTCDNRLERTNGRSINGALACASATFVLLFPANLLPLMHVSMMGTTRESRLGSGVITLWQHQWVIVALLVAAFAVILPFVRFGLLSLVLALLQLGHRPHWLGRAFRWSLHLDQWAMPDVFLIGSAVGYSRVAAAMPVTIDWGGICLISDVSSLRALIAGPTIIMVPGPGKPTLRFIGAARAVRSLADYLDEHPEALLRGRRNSASAH